MNPLATLKEKLMIKPKVEDRERVAVLIKGVKKLKGNNEEKEVKPKLILEGEVVDEREGEEIEGEVLKKEGNEQINPIIEIKTDINFDRNALFKKLAESKKLKVTTKPIIEITEEKTFLPPTPLPITVNKPKKIKGKKRIIIESDDEEMIEEKIGENEEGTEIELKPKNKVLFEELNEKEAIPIKLPKKKTRITEKIEKGVAVLGPETIVEIGDTDLRKRLPKKSPPVLIKVSSYYMNNREIFINFINSLFEPYRKELMENKENISCDVIGKTNTNFSLLTHQKIVRDYMNLYTPYRGLLLYHGLGSGKCHAKDTPIMMSDGNIKYVQNIQVGDLLMGDDSKPRKVISLARGTDKMYDIIPIKGEKYRVNQEHILCLQAQGFPKLLHNNNKTSKKYIVHWIEKNTFKTKTFIKKYNNDNDKYKDKYNKNGIYEKEIKEYAMNFYKSILNNPETNTNIVEIAVKDYLKLPNNKKKI